MKYFLSISLLIFGCESHSADEKIHPNIESEYYSEKFGQFTYVAPKTGVEETTEGIACFEPVVCGEVAAMAYQVVNMPVATSSPVTSVFDTLFYAS